MKNKNIELTEVGYGFFILAEQERKKKSYVKEIEYLTKAHKCMFEDKINKNKHTLNYWQNIIPLKYDKFNFVNENNKSVLKDYKPIFQFQMLVCCTYHSSVPSYHGFLILVLVGSYLINTPTNKKPLFKGGVSH